MQEIIEQLAERIRDAAARREPLVVRGGGTKEFYGRAVAGDVLDTRAYAGIVDYEPTELVITARAGTSLAEIEAAMRERGQMLACEPPHFAEGSTLGGCVAAGLSGPRRPYAGSVRDLVLGIRMLDGKGADLSFGGRVMKNVAGYDVSRLMAGSLGTLGVLLEISLKALPLPPAETTLRREHTAAQAIELMNAWAGKPLPISATCHVGGALYVRLSGAGTAVNAAKQKLGGEAVDDGQRFWRDLRDHRHDFFRTSRPLWRVSLKSTTPPLGGEELIEWSGSVRWLAHDGDADEIRGRAARAGGHATLFRRHASDAEPFHPLSPALARVHARLKRTFDPHGVLNPGRMYAEF
ncbi:MAG TPA: glycolate oxidase subunit GlcE [Burkholderiales bacterium]|nr:glycolate oxidase subunit GlcE [Burkholderiales bacterium]